MKTARAEASAPRRAALTVGDRRWLQGDAEIIRRLRKPLVAISLVSGDIIAAFAAVFISDALMKWAGLPLPDGRRVAIPFLILMLFAVGFYAGFGPNPYERFRLRASSIIGVVAISLIVGLPFGQPAALFAALICEAVCLLLFGHYTEAVIRALLIRARLWGARTAVVGCSDSRRKLAHLLMRQPDFGLSPMGFVATSNDGDMRNMRLPLPLIGEVFDPTDIHAHVEVAIVSSADELATFASDFQVRMPSCRRLLVADEHDIESMWLHTRMLGGAVGIEIRHSRFSRYDWLFKRVIDILFAISRYSYGRS